MVDLTKIFGNANPNLVIILLFIFSLAILLCGKDLFIFYPLNCSLKILAFQTWRTFFTTENPIYCKCFSITIKKSYNMHANSLPSINAVSCTPKKEELYDDQDFDPDREYEKLI